MILINIRSERLHWFRSGGHMAVEARDQLARDSSNWMQYKLTRDRQQFTDNLEDAVNTKWSQFKNKEELSDYLAMKRTESMEERESVRIMVRNKINKVKELFFISECLLKVSSYRTL